MRQSRLTQKFVEFIPDDLEEGVLYVSMHFAVASHKCACGCGSEIVTPLSPTDWQLSFDGLNVSLKPSVGSWSLPCRSHYWIRGGAIRWAGEMSEDAIKEGRFRNGRAKMAYYSPPGSATAVASSDVASITSELESSSSLPTPEYSSHPTRKCTWFGRVYSWLRERTWQ